MNPSTTRGIHTCKTWVPMKMMYTTKVYFTLSMKRSPVRNRSRRCHYGVPYTYPLDSLQIRGPQGWYIGTYFRVKTGRYTVRLRFHWELLETKDHNCGRLSMEDSTRKTERRLVISYRFHYPTVKALIQCFHTLKVERTCGTETDRNYFTWRYNYSGWTVTLLLPETGCQSLFDSESQVLGNFLT